MVKMRTDALTFLFCLTCRSLAAQAPVIHYTIQRRGGAFALDHVVNLTDLTIQLHDAEARFNITRREMQGNKVIRVSREKATINGEVSGLNGEVGRNGTW